MNVHKRIRHSFCTGIAMLAAMAAIGTLLWSRDAAQVAHSPVSEGEKYGITPSSNTCYAASESGFVAVSTGGWQFFDRSGTEIARETASMSAPACDISDSVCAIYCPGDTALQLVYPDGSGKTLDVADTIRYVDVNKSGQLAVLTDREGYKGSVTVYDKHLQPLFCWDAGSDRPICTRLSDKGRLAIGCISEDGSRLLIFRTDREEPLYQYRTDGETILDLAFLNESSVAVLSDLAMSVHHTGQGSMGAESGDGYPALFETSTDLAVQIRTPERYGGGGAISAMADNGRMLGTLSCSGEVLDLAVSKNRILLLTAEELILCSRRLDLLDSQPVIPGTQHIYLRSDNTALAVGSGGVELYDFGRGSAKGGQR